jgi:hypothetical protein
MKKKKATKIEEIYQGWEEERCVYAAELAEGNK